MPQGTIGIHFKGTARESRVYAHDNGLAASRLSRYHKDGPILTIRYENYAEMRQAEIKFNMLGFSVKDMIYKKYGPYYPWMTK
jgi:hypothetical protein